MLAASDLISRLEHFYFYYHLDFLNHHYDDVEADQPPQGAIRARIHEFLAEYGDLLPEA